MFIMNNIIVIKIGRSTNFFTRSFYLCNEEVYSPLMRYTRQSVGTTLEGVLTTY